jgi:Inorganic pyrophosphatase
MRAFIECEAGSDLKRRYDEASFGLKETMRLRAAYPFAYGFLVGVAGGDGGCLDCFLLSDRPARYGEALDCESVDIWRYSH